MRADLLAEPIDGLDEALAAVDAYDQVLVAGLLRPVAEAAEKAAAGIAAEDHFAALAAARTALLGSVHDALMAQVAAAIGRPGGADAGGPGTLSEPAGGPAANLLAAARSWVCELARAGWRGLDSELVSAAAGVVPACLAIPRRGGWRRCLTGCRGTRRVLSRCFAGEFPGATLGRPVVAGHAGEFARRVLYAYH